jgi:hypothetical protein
MKKSLRRDGDRDELIAIADSGIAAIEADASR